MTLFLIQNTNSIFKKFNSYQRTNEKKYPFRGKKREDSLLEY